MALFTGSGVAVVTPFHEDGGVNYGAYEKLIDFLIENGTDAIISCGTTGEASTLTDDEQISVVACAVAAAGKRVPVIAGAGSNHTEHGAALCKSVQKVGADGCLLVTPYYNKATQKGLYEHFKKQAQAADLPVILYNVPSRTSLNILPETLAALSKIDNIVGIKEASDNIVQIAEIAALCGDSFDIYSGNDNQVVSIMALGGKGVISVLGNIAPKQVHDMAMRYLEGDTAGSLKLQLEALPLIRALFSEVNPIPVKAALNMMGINAGGYRLPLTPMDEGLKGNLRQEMIKYGLLVKEETM